LLGSIASISSIDYSTLYKWLKVYWEKRIGYYLNPSKHAKPSKVITPVIHKELEELLNKEAVQFNGCKDVQQWLEIYYEVKIEYQQLWKCLKPIEHPL